MKILLVNNDKGWSGGQEHQKTLAAQLVKLGHDPHFLCKLDSPSERNFELLGYPVHGVPGSGASIVKAIFRTALIMKQELFDVVAVTREHDLLRTVLAWKLAFPFKKKGKLVMCYHTATSRKQLFLSSVDAIVCISRYVRDKLLSSQLRSPSSVTVVHNGILESGEPETEKFTLNRERRFFKNVDFPLIGMVGAFFKNQEELIEIMPMIKREFPSLKVALVGDDSDAGLMEPILAKARALGVADDVILTGKVPHERLDDIFFDIDLSVSTFRNEGFGLVHLESMAAGTPVIAYNEGGQVDILQGGKGGVLVAGGPKEFAEAVIALLQNHEQRFKLGRNGYALVRDKFSAETMGRTYSEFMESLVAGTDVSHSGIVI